MKVKKLVLNKKTIANLNSNEMVMLKGGMIYIPDQSLLYPTCVGCKTFPSECVSHCNDCPAQTGANGGLDTEIC